MNLVFALNIFKFYVMNFEMYNWILIFFIFTCLKVGDVSLLFPSVKRLSILECN